MTISLGIGDSNRQAVAVELAKILADEIPMIKHHKLL
jgi:hypothetical protein